VIFRARLLVPAKGRAPGQLHSPLLRKSGVQRAYEARVLFRIMDAFSGSSHTMRNEMHIRLKCLHRLAQFSCLFLANGSEISLSYDNRRAMKDALKALRLRRGRVGAGRPLRDRPYPPLRHTEDGSFFLGFLPTWRWVLRLLSPGSCSKIKVERYPEGRSLRTGDRRPLPLRWEQILDGSLGDVGRPLMSM
jgi:hypothetical protein